LYSINDFLQSLKYNSTIFKPESFSFPKMIILLAGDVLIT